MAQIIGLPKLSPTMEEGVLIKWHKSEGDPVEPGELIAEVETDKANMDFNLEDEGVLLKLLVAEGETVKLGAPVAILGDEGEDISDLVEEARRGNGEAAAAPSSPPPAPATSEPAARAEPEEAPAPSAPSDRGAAAAPTARAATPGRLLASPLAKTLAIELGIDLRQVQGTGPGGRIVERDVRAVSEGAAGAAPRREAPPIDVAEVGAPTALAVYDRAAAAGALARAGGAEDYEDQPLTGIRRTIAQRLTQAKQEIPHYRLTTDFDAAPLRAFRRRLNELLGERGKVTINDLLIKGCALALRRVPQVNAAFMGDAIRYFTRVHMGVAVALDRGLITPVVRDADLKGIGVIGAEVRDLVRRAKDRELKAHEIQGSTFTISNLGMFGINHFDGIINPPEAALLAVGRIRELPVVRDGQIVVGQRMNMTLSCDHRVVDGALGARFLDQLVELLERPETLAL